MEYNNNKVHKLVEVRVTAKICETYWQEFTDITETKAIEYAKESFLDELPRGWEVDDIVVETVVPN